MSRIRWLIGTESTSITEPSLVNDVKKSDIPLFTFRPSDPNINSSFGLSVMSLGILTTWEMPMDFLK